MGIKTSEIATLAANQSVSFDGSIQAEGTTAVPSGGPNVDVPLPIPAGINVFFAVRIFAVAVLETGNGSGGTFMWEGYFWRNEDGTQIGQPGSPNIETNFNTGGVVIDQPLDDVVIRFQYALNNMYYAWRYTISPAFDPGFVIVSGD